MFYQNRYKYVLFILVLFALSCSSDGPEPQMTSQDNSNNEGTDNPVDTPIQDPRSLEEKLADIINFKVGENKLKGVVVSIRVDGEERWIFTAGDSDDTELINQDMRFGIASITKTVVAATIMKLEEEGLLSLDDPISDHLSLANPNIDPSITIYQLLNHLAGLKGYFQHPDIWPRVENDLLTAIDPIEIADYVGDPLFPPGTQYQYSNSHYLILGLIIEAVTGKTVGEVMREKFWSPLGLNNMFFGANEEIIGPIATPWRDNDGDGTLENIADQFGPAYHSIFYTAADVFATASDLSNWAHLLFTAQAVTESSRNRMTTFLRLDDPIANGYGLGIRRVQLGGRDTWGHTGGMRGYGSYMFYEPASKISVAMLNNQSRSENGPQLRYELMEELFYELYISL